jgi:signal peptidase
VISNVAAKDHELMKCRLAADAIRTFGKLRFRVTGSSMVPSVWPCDILRVRRAEMAQVFPGDIVLFERDGRLCAHRVVDKIVGRDQTHLVTQGQQLSSVDPPVFPRELLGRATSIERGRFLIDPRAGLRTRWRLVSMVLRRSAFLTRVTLHMLASPRSSVDDGAA